MKKSSHEQVQGETVQTDQIKGGNMKTTPETIYPAEILAMSAEEFSASLKRLYPPKETKGSE